MFIFLYCMYLKIMLIENNKKSTVINVEFKLFFYQFLLIKTYVTQF